MGKTVRGGTVVSGLPFGGAVAPGDLVGWSANKLVKATGIATGNIPAVGVALAAQAANDTGAIAIGAVEVDGYAGLTVGADQYLDVVTAGDVQEGAPTAAGQYKQRVGYALAADRVQFNLPVLGEVVTTNQEGVFTAVVGTGGVALGDLVGWGSGGDAGKIVKANGATGSNIPAIAVAAAAYAAAATGTFVRSALVTVAGRTPGAVQYLSVAAAGASQEAAPTVMGQLAQKVGYALSATSMWVNFPTAQEQVSANALGSFSAVVGTGGVTVGDLVGWGSGGDAGKIVKANGVAGGNIPAIGVAAGTALATETVTVNRSQLVTVAGRTAGAAQYLSVTVAGGSQEAAPTVQGELAQRVGYALSATSLWVCFPPAEAPVSLNAEGSFTQVVGTGGVTVGDLVGWGAGGDAGKLIKASAAGGANVPAVAVAAQTAAAGVTATFNRTQLVTVAGRTAGAAQYLAEAGGGASQEAAPVGATKYKQIVGWARSATSLFVCLPEVGAQL